MEHYLDLELKKYTAGDVYPFHMPGHKRQRLGDWQPEEVDITEISGFDDLHHAAGILAEAQERMARVCGSGAKPEGPRFSAYYLVNGSTAGILAAISAAAGPGDRVLAARNSHKAVYHGICLRQLQAEYLWPMETESGIQGSIDPADVEAWFLKKERSAGAAAETGAKAGDNAEKMAGDNAAKMAGEGRRPGKAAAAVIITSPTYDGVVSDIAAIAKIAHSHGAALIVDEAHGAHFGFSGGFPDKAIALGADYVIESLHKTLPAFTQSAVIHAADSPFTNRERLEFFLQVYQTSSPSYVLMAGMDRCARILADRGKELFAAFEKRLDDFYDRAGRLKNIRVLPAGPAEGIFDRDPSKILISACGLKEPAQPAGPGSDPCGQKTPVDPTGPAAAGACGSGEELFAVLRDRFGLELEMAAGDWATALTGIMDTDEGFDRLSAALQTLDRELAGREASAHAAGSGASEIYRKTDAVMTIFEAAEAPHDWVPFAEAAGRISGGMIFLYPPGIPILAPGERIPEESCAFLADREARGIDVRGIKGGCVCCTREE